MRNRNMIIRMLMVLVLMPIIALANTEIVDGITWSYNVSGGMATITSGSSNHSAIPNTTTGVIAIPTTLGRYPVKRIGTDAFYNCKMLTSVTIPVGVTYIGQYAFDGCDSLRTVALPSGLLSIDNQAFRGCTSLVSVEVPASVTSIGIQAFGNCVSLVSVTLPEGVQSIGWYAFSGCSSLTSIRIPSSLVSIGDRAFMDCSSLASIEVAEGNPAYCSVDGILYNISKTQFIQCPQSIRGSVKIPKGITSIVDGAFSRCEKLTSVTISEGVASIAANAFSGCSALTEILVEEGNACYCSVDGVLYNKTKTQILLYPSGKLGSCFAIPKSVVAINDYAFYGCNKLASVSIPEGVVSIGWNSFNGCTSLVSTLIPSTVKGIGERAFGGCSSLTTLTLNEGLESIGLYAFNGCSSLASVIIPSSVTSCGYGAFYECSSLAAVTISDGVTSVSERMFFGCNSLTSVKIPESVKSIGSLAFGSSDKIVSLEISSRFKLVDVFALSYDKIKSVTLADGVTFVGAGLFSGCISLESVIIPESVTSIGSKAFSGCKLLSSITIPSSVKTIGSGAFEDCVGLQGVCIDSLTAWCEIDFLGDKANPLTYAHKLYLNGDVVTNAVIPDGVERIRDWTFYHCDTLGSVVLPEGVVSIGDYAFYSCRSLASVSIPGSVTSIGDYAFLDCSSLTSMMIPKGVKSVGSRAFEGCSRINSVHINDLAAWCEIAFHDLLSNPLAYSGMLYLNGQAMTDLDIPNSITSIGMGAFYGCSGLKSVTIPLSVISIGNSAFANCRELTSLTIPSSVKAVGNSAFSGCVTLTSLVISDGVLSIGDSAFCDCRMLSELTIPKSVMEIGYAAFHGCSSVVRMSLPFVGKKRGGTGTIDSVFGYIFGRSSYTDAMAIKQYYSKSSYVTYDIPSSLNEIVITDETILGYGALCNCDMLTSVMIPESIKSIGEKAFFGCTGLKSLMIPHGVANIGEEAFKDCSGLTSVIMSDGVTNIAERAFCNCSSLKSATIPTSVISIGYSVFCGCAELRSLVMPFVGSERGNTGVSDSLFGYIFGSSSYVGATKVVQYYAASLSSDYYVPSLLKEVVITDETMLGYGAFSNCRMLTSLTIPPSIMSAGCKAFSGCSGLEAVCIENLYSWCKIEFASADASPLYFAHRLFFDGNEVSNLVLPEAVTSIGEYAFSGCTGIVEVTLPSRLRSIGAHSFDGCVNLSVFNVKFEANALSETMAMLNSVGMDRDKIRLVYPDSGNNVIVINEVPWLFSYCKGGGVEIASGVPNVPAIPPETAGLVVVPDEIHGHPVIAIGDGAFRGCSKIDNIIVPKSVNTIECWSFRGCMSVTNMVLPFIGESRGESETGYRNNFSALFGGGWGDGVPKTLRSVAITDDSIVCDYAFQGCSNIASIVINEGVDEIKAEAFDGSKIKDITLPSSVKRIRYDTFKNCHFLENIFVKQGNVCYYDVDGILYSNNELVRCPARKRVVNVAEGAARLCESAFEGCDSLSIIEMPPSVKRVESGVFAGCSNIQRVVMGTLMLPTLRASGWKRVYDGSYVASGSGTMWLDVRFDTPTYYSFSWGTSHDCDFSGVLALYLDNKFQFSSEALTRGVHSQGVEVPAGVHTIRWECRDAAYYWDSYLSPTLIYPQAYAAGKVSEIFPDSYRVVKTIVINDGEQSIGGAFCNGCEKLSLVKIPQTVKTIGKDAFKECDDLAMVCVANGDVARMQGLYTWPQNVVFVEGDIPVVADDADSTVRADGTGGLIVKPSADNSSVEVVMPEGCDASRITVELSPKVVSVKPHGAKVSIVNGVDNITEFLDIPETDENGVIDLTKATVKEEYVEETMDPKKGAVIELNMANPILTTPNTRKGLFYQLREGLTLDGMKDGDSIIGNGEPWSPGITVKNCKSAFYSIGVGIEK